MKRVFYWMITALFAFGFAVASNATAPTKEMAMWQDPELFEINRLPMRATFTTDQEKSLSLNGTFLGRL